MYRNLSPRATRSVLTALVALCFCASQASAAAPKYAAGAVSNGGSIKGTIKASPKQDETLKVTKDNSHCGDSVPAEKFIIGGDGGLKNAVVKLEGITKGKDFASKDDPVITNKDCKFAPHVMVARKGAKMKVRNDDPLLHNSHFYLLAGKKKKNVINLALPKQGLEISKKKILRKTGLLSLQCDAHDFMQSWVWVLDHPYAVVTGSDGSFELSDVPAGSYKLTIWHEALGEKTVDVTVAAGKTATIDHSF
jgi:hypothetical protein